MEFKILKDKYINCWIVWEVHKNYSIDRYHAKTKKRCQEWLKI
jgi:hypothetical protein